MKRALFVLFVTTRAFAQASNEPPAAPPPPPADTPPPPRVAPSDPAVALREANAAATAGDWKTVQEWVTPLLAKQLDRADLAEAHRLAGIAALFAQPPRRDLAEKHFIEYLRIDFDGHLDPALYPPEVVNFFNDVRARHPELKPVRKNKRYWMLTLVPPLAQFQNGDKVKGWVIGGLIGAFAITNVATYFTIRSWCEYHEGSGGSRPTCDDTTNHTSSAKTLRVLNITAGVGLILTYAFGVWDGVRGYRRETRAREIQPYTSSTNGGAIVGVHLTF